MSPPREHTGVWAGPGILVLVDGVWIHFLPRDAPRDLTARATALVGTDTPKVCIHLAEDMRDETQAPGDRP